MALSLKSSYSDEIRQSISIHLKGFNWWIGWNNGRYWWWHMMWVLWQLSFVSMMSLSGEGSVVAYGCAWTFTSNNWPVENSCVWDFTAWYDLNVKPMLPCSETTSTMDNFTKGAEEGGRSDAVVAFSEVKVHILRVRPQASGYWSSSGDLFRLQSSLPFLNVPFPLAVSVEAFKLATFVPRLALHHWGEQWQLAAFTEARSPHDSHCNYGERFSEIGRPVFYWIDCIFVSFVFTALQFYQAREKRLQVGADR